MKKALIAAIYALPTVFFIALGQLSATRRPFFAALFILFSILVCCQRNKEKQTKLHLITGAFRYGLLLMAIFVAGCTFFPVGGYLAQPLILEHSDKNAHAILVLASGASPTGDPGFSGMQRVLHGVKLLKEQKAPRLFISTGYSKTSQHLEAAWVASYTQLLEVCPASLTILVSKKIVTTVTEAEYAYQEMSKLGIHKILLVTSGAHIYRSCSTFCKVGFEVYAAPVHNKNNIFYANENYLASFNAAIHEWLGLILYSLRQNI